MSNLEVSINNKQIKKSLWQLIKDDISNNIFIYIMLIPLIAYFVIFCYLPMIGIVIAFQNFTPAGGFINSHWVGFEHFIQFFTNTDSIRIIKNTIMISVYSIIVGFPAPIILALLLNEITNNAFKKSVQTFTYMPHFISIVVVCGMIKIFTASDGIINSVLSNFGADSISLLLKPEFFRSIYVLSGVWQEIGWGSIIYLAALSSINTELYESAAMDGAGRFKQVIHITLPGIMPTILILLILRIGGVMSVGFDKIILLYSPTTYVTADVISTYVYRYGLQNFNYSYSTAVGLFNSLINFALVALANSWSKKVNGSGLW